MPLSMVKKGENMIIKKILGRDETKRFLESLGFLLGGSISVISELEGNMILSVKGARIAIDKNMANKIIVGGV